MTISISGPTRVDETVGLTPSSPGCSSGTTGTTCVVNLALMPCTAAGTCYSASVTTYDAVSCSGGACTIPSGAAKLSTNQNVGFAIATGKSNTVSLTLDGVPITAGIVPGVSSTLTGSSGAGFTISKCVTTPQSVTVAGFDADGNQIVGQGSPTGYLSSDDTLHLNAAAQPWVAPNAYSLVPPSSLQAGPSIPDAKSVVHLTAIVVPQADTGTSTPVITPVNVQFNGDICEIVTEFPVPVKASPIPTADNPEPSGIAAGPDGAMWFAEKGGNRIGRITIPKPLSPAVVTDYYIPTSNAIATAIAAGSDDALWFLETFPSKIGRIGVNGQVSEYSTSASPTDIALGSDGAMWFTECTASNIGRISTSGSVTQFPMPSSTSDPNGIVGGSDGNLWVAEAGTTKIARITTAHAITEFPTGGLYPVAVTLGPDGAIWFTSAYYIGRMTTAGAVTSTYLGEGAVSLATGADGNVWFAANNVTLTGANLGYITPSGQLTELPPLQTYNSVVGSIAPGPDGAIWFTEIQNGLIGRMQ